MKSVNSNVLYISYDGILEPLGQSQVLSYLEELSHTRNIFLISFEKSSDKKNRALYAEVSDRVKKTNIQWHPLTYHRRPTTLATLWDILNILILSFWLTVRYDIKIVHTRSYVASLGGLLLKKFLRTSFVFDMRGFWADERIDGEIWPEESYLYNIAKKFEKLFLLNADVVVSLTNKAVNEIKSFPYLIKKIPVFVVIPTCTDLKVFKPELKTSNGSFILGYVGSVGVWYLFKESLLFFKALKRLVPDAKLHIINKGDHDYIRLCLEEVGLHGEDVIVESASRNKVALAMKRMSAGIFFIKPVYSKIASMPTKLGEFLGCGVPCVCNYGVGDMSEILEKNRVGIALDNFSEDTMKRSVLELLELLKDPDLKSRCSSTSIQNFSLEKGVISYEYIYTSLS